MGFYDLYRSYISKCHSEMEILSSVRNEPTLLPLSLRTQSLYLTIYAFASVLLLNIFFLAIIRFNNKSKIKLRDDIHSIKNSYQATNFCVNLSLGLYGLYTWILVVPGLYTIPAPDKIIGFHEYVPFSAAQLGYNIWSIPMGVFIIGESKAMIGHHVAAFIISFLASFFTIGYRYYSPFFLGFYELSSVPLAIMNSFKNNREWANANSPISFVVAKVLFAVFYLVIRVFLGTPQMYDNMRIATLLFISCETNSCRFMVSIFTVLGYFMALLQYVWGYMVVSGLYQVYKGKPDTKRDTKNEKKD